MKRQFLLTMLVLALFITQAIAQKSKSFTSSEYTNAIGIKLYPATAGAAVTFKHFINQGAALEALGTVWDKGTRATGLYEFHFDIPSVEGLKWYVGPGAHVGFYKRNTVLYSNNQYSDASYVAAGIDGVIGADYKFKKIPLNLSADWQPAIEFGSNRYNGFGADFGGISARYTF